MAIFNASRLLAFLSFLAFALAQNIPPVDYDVIVVGGGPAGLSALSGLSRVRRTALLVDSSQYRNGLTRRMHDIIGSDGVVPSVFRYEARQQIAKYDTATMTNGTVLDINQVKTDPSNLPHFLVTINPPNGGPSYIQTARKIVLATGLEDILPNTPGLAEAWSRGIYWCPWCDGFEHRDQPLGIIGDVSGIKSAMMEVATINQDVMAFTNNSDTPLSEIDGYEELKNNYGVKFEPRAIKNITRIQDGSIHFDAKNGSEFDMFAVHFEDEGNPVNRAAFLTNFESKQRSDLPQKMGLKMADGKIDNKMEGMHTSMDGVFAVGDCNNDGSTNVPHAMFSGKRAAVYIHVAMEKENATAMNMHKAPEKRAQPLSVRELEEIAEREIGNDLETLWQAKVRS
ncbi:hypothetical protein AJ79_03120 [Helicocarpus griseus UAMH5409]|uniref:FAD/NAD(P)-binding domain-containing protein n=1 Tax=Helicocarpus griseus UAMH5409 TaxID=1447875 RepID=A0A2B7Y0G4_9EURO|nr:hypothetical protein AJ79_03120 [Helicocarpus griseus UAMH5409]